MSDWSTLKQRVAGKWQIPLFVLSVCLLAGSVLRLRPSPTNVSIEDGVGYLDVMIEEQLYERSIDFARKLLDREAESAAQRSPVYLRLARANSLRANRDRTFTIDAGRQITEHYDVAMQYGQRLDVHDVVNLARANRWQQAYRKAFSYYKQAVDEGGAEFFHLRKSMIELMRDKLSASPSDLEDELDEFLAQVEPHRIDLKLWALEQKLYQMEALGELGDATSLLVKYKPEFAGTDFSDHFSILESYLLYRTGRFDEAEATLRTIRNRVARDSDAYAMSGWLLGRVVLSDGGPQRPMEALSFFDDVLAYHPSGPYALLSRLGSAEAYAQMARHDDAISMYRIAMEDLPTMRDSYRVDRGALMTSLNVSAELLRQSGDFRASLEYAKLAVELEGHRDSEQTLVALERLAQIYVALGEQIDGQSDATRLRDDPIVVSTSAKAKRYYADAAETYAEISQISTMRESRSASSQWQSANLLARAGLSDRAVDAYRSFAMERPANPLVPRAILRIGQILQGAGRIPKALDAFQECYRRFPRTVDGSRSLIPLAQCYLSLGPDSEELAEKTLQIVLDDSDVFTPEAPEFATALFLLGDILNRRNSNERAIAALEEALQRYPEDARVARTQYLVADSYRRSALGLKSESANITAEGELAQIKAEVASRFGKARQLYRELIDEYELRGDGRLTKLEQLYRRHAYLYEADCYFEVQEYRKALALYEEAVGIFKETPTALAAYVQIINCHVFLGESGEARAALSRAIVLASAMPDQAFDQSVSLEGQSDWSRYLKWLGDAELF